MEYAAESITSSDVEVARSVRSVTAVVAGVVALWRTVHGGAGVPCRAIRTRAGGAGGGPGPGLAVTFGRGIKSRSRRISHVVGGCDQEPEGRQFARGLCGSPSWGSLTRGAARGFGYCGWCDADLIVSASKPWRVGGVMRRQATLSPPRRSIYACDLV